MYFQLLTVAFCSFCFRYLCQVGLNIPDRHISILYSVLNRYIDINPLLWLRKQTNTFPKMSVFLWYACLVRVFFLLLHLIFISPEQQSADTSDILWKKGRGRVEKWSPSGFVIHGHYLSPKIVLWSFLLRPHREDPSVKWPPTSSHTEQQIRVATLSEGVNVIAWLHRPFSKLVLINKTNLG